jgi:DNA mismatch repair ATPase MutS
MSFIADKQTLDDLNLLGKYKNNSVYRLFDHVVTDGGRKLLDNMFNNPLTNADAINKRCSIFQYVGSRSMTFPFTNEDFSIMENYLSSGGGGSILSTATGMISKKVLSSLAQDKEYGIIEAELCKTIELLNVFSDFISKLQQQDAENPYQEEIRTIKNILSDKRLQWLSSERGIRKIPLAKLIRYDNTLRSAMYEEMRTISDVIYNLDVCIAVSGVANAKGFAYPQAFPKEKNVFAVTGLFHPGLAKAVANSISVHQHSNVIFLTGANMAGKSTFMKSFGISFYLAHMGFPVAAESMQFSVKDGMYSSINVPDNLNMGYSHFYAEVLRVKKVAEEVSDSKDLLVIFDELFKGTNVKDAYDATLAITEAFSENRNCFFIISTHIIEVGEALREHSDHFQFVYLPTVMDGHVPRYTYRLEEGITTDRHGMMIIENEGILDIIRSGTKYEVKV